MPTYSFYIEDERYSVPTLLFVRARDEREARRLARDELASSAHPLKIEVRENDHFLFRLVQPDPGRQGEGTFRDEHFEMLARAPAGADRARTAGRPAGD